MTATRPTLRALLLKISNLTVYFGQHCVLNKVNFHIHCGEVIAIVGSNGAGKTTFLRAILGEIPYQGTIESHGGGILNKKLTIGYVPQKLHINPDSPMNVTDLVIAAISHHPIWMGINQKLSQQAQAILALFSAKHLAHKKLGELSGGELQRVLLAIAMTAQPELLLLDEPGTGIDVEGLACFYQTVRALKNQHDIAVIIITHDLDGIEQYVDRIVRL